MKPNATNPPATGPDPAPAGPKAAARNLIVLPELDRSFVPTGAEWRGITWQDVPGHDAPIQKLNFALLKRGMLRGHKECAGLHGDALRQRLQDISERNRDNSHRQQEQARQRNPSRVRKKKPRPRLHEESPPSHSPPVAVPRSRKPQETGARPTLRPRPAPVPPFANAAASCTPLLSPDPPLIPLPAMSPLPPPHDFS